MSRKIILVLHPTRDEAHALAQEIVNDLNNKNFAVLTSSIVDIAGVVKLSDSELIAQRNDAELVLVLGGDGTILRGAEIAHGSELPVLGINLGHVGFLAQIEKPSIAILVDAISNRSYSVEKRMTLAYKVERGDSVLTNGWAL
ncbi:MAG: NAD(+)/NADH kinase, partial [Actinomycetales bacterium]